MIVNKIADKTTKVSRNSLQNNPERLECETENMGFDTEIPKETCISLEKKEQIIDKLKLK